MPFAEMRMDLETVIQKEKKNHILYVESRNMILMNIFLQSGNRDTDVENKCMATQGGKGRWDELGDWDRHIPTTIYKPDNQ